MRPRKVQCCAWVLSAHQWWGQLDSLITDPHVPSWLFQHVTSQEGPLNCCSWNSLEGSASRKQAGALPVHLSWWCEWRSRSQWPNDRHSIFRGPREHASSLRRVSILSHIIFPQVSWMFYLQQHESKCWEYFIHCYIFSSALRYVLHIWFSEFWLLSI